MNMDSVLNYQPRRLLEWQEDQTGQAVLLRPKFGESRLARWCSKYFQNPHYRIRLDDIGTLVWKSCDGSTTLSSILQSMREHFGTGIEPAEERLWQFLQTMLRSRLIELSCPESKTR